MKKFLLKSCIGIGLLFVVAQQVQVFANSANIDNTFDVWDPIWFNDRTTSISKQSDGKIIVGWKFRTYRGILAPHLIRLNADGTVDPTFKFTDPFDPGINTEVHTTIQSNGKIIVGIYASDWNGNYNKVMRLNTDWSIDSWFNDWSWFNTIDWLSNYISTIEVQSDGKVLVGGWWLTFFNWERIFGLVRLNADGTRDTSFDVWTERAWFNLGGDTIHIQNDGKIIISNSMQWMLWTDTAHDIVRLNSDGTEDTGFALAHFDGDGVLIWWLQSYQINDFAIQNDGKIVIVGVISDFTWNFFNILRLNTDGTLDDTFSGGISLDNTPLKVKIENDGKILLFMPDGLIRLNTDGSINNSFSILPIGMNYDVIWGNWNLSITIQNDGKILLGWFIWYDGGIRGVSIPNMIRINTDGTLDTTFNQGNGLNHRVSALGLQTDGKVVIGGNFTSYQWNDISHLIRLNADGTLDTGFTNNLFGFIDTINIQNDGKLIVGWTELSGNSFIYPIYRLNADGSIDNSFNSGNGFDSDVRATAIQSDGKIIVGGWFRTYKWVSVNRLIRLNADWSLRDSFSNAFDWNTSPVNEITDIKIQSDGKVLVLGTFKAMWGVSSNRIVRLLSGTLNKDSTFKVWSGFNSKTTTLALQSDGKILVGGDFTNYSGSTVNRIVRLNTWGTLDTSFVTGSGFDNTVTEIAVQNDGKIIIAGLFRTYNGSVANGLIGLNTDGSIDTWFVTWIWLDMVARGRYTEDSVLRIQSGWKIFLGGQFTNFNGKAAGYLTSFYGNAPVVDLPASNDTGVVAAAFLAKGYTQSNGDLMGTMPISLASTNGDIPVDLSIKNTNITVSLDANTQLTQADATTPYDGLLSVPTTKSIASVNDQTVISSFKVGSSSESIKLTWGIATLSLPVPGQTIGTIVQVYYSENNGVSWYPQTQTPVIDKNGQPYVEFTTTHFTDFAITSIPDTTAPIPTITYDITGTTANDVIASISLNETGSITNNGGNASYTFTDNGSFTFTFQDTAGNTGSATATVNWIDKTPVNTWSNWGGSNWGGGGGSSRSEPITNIISKVVDALKGTEETSETHSVAASIAQSPYTSEVNTAYLWAYNAGITTIPTIQKANIEGKLYRSHLAKMISEYAVKELKKVPNTGTNCSFSDTNTQSQELQAYTKTACQLGLMGLKSNGTPNTTFNPTAEVTRAEFGTTLSRLLYGSTNNEKVWGKRYTAHLKALQAAGIMTKIDKPTMNELRGNVFLMLMRTVK